MASVKTVWPTDPPYLQAAFSVLGLSEIEGSKHEKRVLEMYAASGHPEIHDDETPWCAAFIGWCLDHGGLKGTQSLMARSYATYGTALSKSEIVPRGAIAVWTRDGGGHVNFVLADDGKFVTCIGGNQSNNKGGGVTISRRAKADAVAYRMPPKVVQAVEAGPTPAVTAARTVGGTVAVGTAATQVVSAITGPVTDTVEQVKTVIDTGGQVVDVTKQVVTAPPAGFWSNTLAFVQSPKFLAIALIIVCIAWAITYYLRTHKEQQA